MLEASATAVEPAASPRYWLQDQPPDLEVTDGDSFAVSALVDRLVTLVKASPAPFTLSLSGSWGIGKSTIAETLIKRVRKEPNAMKACLVDAWGEDIEHLRRTLAIAVGAELLGGDAHREEVADRIDKPIGLTRAVSTPRGEFVLPDTLQSIPRHLQQVLIAIVGIEVLILAALLLAGSESLKFLVPILAGVLGATLTAAITKTDILFRVENTTETKAPAAESVHMAREFAAAVTGTDDDPSSQRVLVVVDNLDRLPGRDALRALAEIRSLVEIKGSRCVFLIPVDRAAFATHIETALTNDISAKSL